MCLVWVSWSCVLRMFVCVAAAWFLGCLCAAGDSLPSSLPSPPIYVTSHHLFLKKHQVKAMWANFMQMDDPTRKRDVVNAIFSQITRHQALESNPYKVSRNEKLTPTPSHRRSPCATMAADA